MYSLCAPQFLLETPQPAETWSPVPLSLETAASVNSGPESQSRKLRDFSHCLADKPVRPLFSHGDHLLPRSKPSCFRHIQCPLCWNTFSFFYVLTWISLPDICFIKRAKRIYLIKKWHLKIILYHRYDRPVLMPFFLIGDFSLVMKHGNKEQIERIVN